MTKNTNSKSRRNFLKISAAVGGGLLVGFQFSGCKESVPAYVAKALPNTWTGFDAYIKIGETGLVTIFSPNPEIGQNIKTSMPMIVAEELEVDWRDVVVEQAPLHSEWYKRQVAGGSQSIRQEWETLRKAGASVRQMLVETAAEKWGVSPTDCSVENGVVSNKEGEKFTYGELATDASKRKVPEEPTLKSPNDFKIIGNSKRNVDMEAILSGKPLFGLDFKREGMLHASVMRPPAFGKTLKSFDDSLAKKVNGVVEIIRFGDKIAVLANNTWAAMKGQKALKATWKQAEKGETTSYHSETLLEHLNKKSKEPRRVDGDVDKAFAEADQVVERIYEAPFLPHNCMEPMNFFADVRKDKVELIGPVQTPAWTEKRVADLLERDVAEIDLQMTRMGGGFGRRLYGDFALEAAEISKLSGKPIKVIFSREDDMLAGIYRPASAYKFKVGIKDGVVTAYHLTEACFGGMMFGSMPNNFPCGAIENYRVDCHKLESNITTGAWRAPYANFLASAEQSFLDELAGILEKDALQFRLDLFEKAKTNPVGEEYNYEIDKYAGVIQLVAEKAAWGKAKEGVYQGLSAYFSHNTYVAEIANVVIKDGLPVVDKIICAVDCGIVINPKAALNQIEGGIIDGIGHAMYGDFKFENGRSQSSNFHQYNLIRMPDAPKIEVHFVESQNDPTGLGEPTLPPAAGAIANAFAAATKKRFYKQPFIQYKELLG